MRKINIVSFVIILFTFGCKQSSINDKVIQSELNLRTDSTITLDIDSCSVDEYPVSKLIDSVRYISLENSDSALIGIVKTVKVTRDLIYVLDLKTDILKCFNSNGKFIRNACEKGGGPEEIGHLIDFDIDENFLYVLDGAKVAIHIFDHKGIYVRKAHLPFRAQKMKCLPNNNYLFELSPFELNNEKKSSVMVYCNNNFKPIIYYLDYIDGAFNGVAFENQFNSSYFSCQYGNGIYERKDNSIYMKYYLDFNGKHFNKDKQEDGFKEAVEKCVYFTSFAPLHNKKYLLSAYTAGLKRDAVLLVDLNKDKALFVKRLIQDRGDLIDFNFSHTLGYDVFRDEFFGICNYLDLSGIEDNKVDVIGEIKEVMPKKVQSFLLQENGDKKVNQILLFYKLKDEIM